ncbi:hypothetical protein POTOM_043463 [Populus tomentosa]|uniref:Uncharacterized protein n=1 Tax=Populus tomentosa TaxID=118781 RepID=A0A8X8CGF0_POPTO|nr:hypothetical protein POTOM_043463 [Populus tomentosa]
MLPEIAMGLHKKGPSILAHRLRVEVFCSMDPRTPVVVSNNYTRISSFQVLELEQQSISYVSYEGHDEVSAEINSLKDQQYVGENEVNGFEYQIRSKDEDIRRLEHELALKDEEGRHLKSQLDLREKEFARLRIAIWATQLPLLRMLLTNNSPPKKGIENLFTEKDLLGAELSGQRLLSFILVERRSSSIVYSCAKQRLELDL